MSRLVVTIKCSPEAYHRLGLTLSFVEMLLGEKLFEDVEVKKEGEAAQKKAAKGPKVQYRVVMKDAIEAGAIEEQSVKGKLFLYLLHQGPKTAKEIHSTFAEEHWTMKSVESSIHKLKSMGVIEPEEVSPIPEVE